MASEAELLALASACEKATGPARSIDYAIGYHEGEHNQPPEMWQYIMPKSKTDNHCPRYTASLDAAMTLVPEGLWAEGSLSSPGQLEVHGPCTFDPIGKGWAATPALALCAAALKARATTMGGSDA